MNENKPYPIGQAGIAWQQQEKSQWLAMQHCKRSYFDDVVQQINDLKNDFDVIQYGVLNYQKEYPLFAIQTKSMMQEKPTVLVTGGVHGYETSGVHGALAFIARHGVALSEQVNLIVVPCVSPWGYETINRWNQSAIDPNRSFYENSPAPESAQLMAYMKTVLGGIALHIDLHETTDTDNSEFRPALAARDGVTHCNWNIPDGFYLVGDTQRDNAAFQKAIIDAVAAVTHIAPADENDQLIGVEIEQFGVINYACKELGLCAGLTDAPLVTTTEVYPDSPLVDDANCVDAQVKAVTAAIEFLLA